MNLMVLCFVKSIEMEKWVEAEATVNFQSSIVNGKTEITQKWCKKNQLNISFEYEIISIT